jgi:hypothetical protein
MLSFTFQNGNKIKIKAEQKAKWVVELMMETQGSASSYGHTTNKEMQQQHPPGIHLPPN